MSQPPSQRSPNDGPLEGIGPILKQVQSSCYLEKKLRHSMLSNAAPDLWILRCLFAAFCSVTFDLHTLNHHAGGTFSESLTAHLFKEGNINKTRHWALCFNSSINARRNFLSLWHSHSEVSCPLLGLSKLNLTSVQLPYTIWISSSPIDAWIFFSMIVCVWLTIHESTQLGTCLFSLVLETQTA